jgi:citrate synthase
MPDSEALTARQAADRLGVKPETLYAYVSRGLLARARAGDGRSSRFDAGEVERLAQSRNRRQARAGALEMTVQSSLTAIAGDRLFYRGRDVVGLSRTRAFEEIAGWLWTGEWSAEPWRVDPEIVAVARAAAATLPAGAHLLDQLRVIVAAAGSADLLRFDLRPDAVVVSARTLLTTMVEALPLRSAGAVPKVRIGESDVPLTLAARLWCRLSERRPPAGVVEALNAALVLMADHELAASTLAARVAASVRADPYSVVTAGLGALGGPLHGSVSASAHQLLETASRSGPGGAAAALSELNRRQPIVPGFGHPLYPAGDPRARALIAALRASAAPARRVAVVDELAEAMAARAGVPPNSDLAIGALTFAAGLAPDAGEGIMAIARSAGWIAHALEEYEERGGRFRPRALYVGAPAEP